MTTETTYTITATTSHGERTYEGLSLRVAQAEYRTWRKVSDAVTVTDETTGELVKGLRRWASR